MQVGISETYDQICVVAHDKRLPSPVANAKGGAAADGFDFGMFNFVDLFANALHGKAFKATTKLQQKALLKKFEHDFSDHMPIWIRLPKP